MCCFLLSSTSWSIYMYYIFRFLYILCWLKDIPVIVRFQLLKMCWLFGSFCRMCCFCSLLRFGCKRFAGSACYDFCVCEILFLYGFMLILEIGDILLLSYRWIFWCWYQLGDVELSILKMCKFVGVSLFLDQVLFFLVEKLIFCTSNDKAMYDNL